MCAGDTKSMRNRYGLLIFCAGLSLALLAWVLGVNGLGPLDDHRMIGTIFQGKDFGFYISPELGRFFPLAAQEYVVIAKLVVASPALFYSFNAFKLLAVGFILYKCLAETKLGGLGVAIIWCVVVFSVGVANTLFRLSASELNLLILMLAFVWSALIVMADCRQHEKRVREAFAIFGLFSLCVALFYKETVFVVGVAFGVFEWLRYARNRSSRPPLFVYVSVLIGTAYMVGYFVWRFLFVTGSYASFHSQSVIDVFLKFAYSDPFLILVAAPLTAYRLVVIFRDPAKHQLYDSLLVAAGAYVAVYLALSMFNWYYLLPAYAFAATGVAGVLATLGKKWVSNFVLAASLLCGLNTLPLTIADIQAQKSIANNHYQFVNVVSAWLRTKDGKGMQPRVLTLVGVSSGNGIEIIHSLKTFLVALGVPEKYIEVRGGERSDNLAISQFHGIKEQSEYVAQPGDLLLFNPYQQVFTPPPLQAPSTVEIYRSQNEWALPRWVGWQWAVNCVFDRGNCTDTVKDNMRYSGYAAFLVVRGPAIVTLRALKSPKYRAVPENWPRRMAANTTHLTNVLVENTGSETWPANGRLQEGEYVNLAYRWFDESGRVAFEGDRVAFPEPMMAGDKVRVALSIKTPVSPGQYRLVISPVQEGVAWFKDGHGEAIQVY